MSETKLYWNYATGGVECEKSDNNCPIIKSPNDDNIVIESWWTDCAHTHAINFAYIRGSVRDRNRFFEENNVNPQELRWLMIPKPEYEQLMIKVLEPEPTKWISIGSLSMVCSECGLKSSGNTPYCPWCGRPKYHADTIKELEEMQEAKDEQ